MPLNSTDINIDYLKDEFRKLGFHVESNNLDGSLMITPDGVFKVTLTYSVTNPEILAEHFSVLCIGKVPRDITQKPVIEVIIADLHDHAPGNEKEIKVNLEYTNVDRPLPDKGQILRALTGLLILKNAVKKFLLDNSDPTDIKNQIKGR